MGRFLATTDAVMSDREKCNQEKVREIASQGMVLLENKGVLPLPENVRKIALFGAGARKTVKGGTGSGEVNSRNVINVERGLIHAGYEVTTKKWLNAFDEKVDKAYKSWGEAAASQIREGVSVFLYLMERGFRLPEPQEITWEDIRDSETDTAIYVISRNSGEGADRHNAPGDYQLSAVEENHLKILAQGYKSLIVVLNTGGVIDTAFLRNIGEIGAILLMSQAGNVGGDALADVISGKVNPSGKLTDTWAEKYEDYPFAEEFSHNNGDLDDAYYHEGIYVGYRYFDTFRVKPAYPFGFGLSYTNFSIKPGRVKIEKGNVQIAAEIKNEGNRAGKEVVQIYVSAPEGRIEKPYQELKAFQKTKLLNPGESQKLILNFSSSDMAVYSEEKAAWILEKGCYYIRIGNSSRNTVIAGAVIVKEDKIVCTCRNLVTLDCELEELTKEKVCDIEAYPGEAEEKLRAKQDAVYLDERDVFTENTVYQNQNFSPMEKTNQNFATLMDVREGHISLQEFVGQLSVEEMALLCTGRIREGFSAIGNAAVTVPGAAGETTEALFETRKVPSMILADGPAGLRLTKEFSLDRAGNLLEDGGFDLPEVICNAMKGKTDCAEKEEKVATYYQFCTAIPIATLLAQTWDMELIEECSSVVGEEMLLFGVTLWLAPGMNIHRNPLCGRNFEYYSEDPLLSGLCAAAGTKGVQKHPGVGTTIKHFATNNQEANRSFENNHVSERALREIYLKGFEICVRKEQPMAIMTSYNLLNGLHTANRFDLLTSIARDEWGFQGVIMTDWGTTGNMSVFNQCPKYPSSSAAMCIQAGNDLIMPGTKEDVKEIINSVGAEKEDVLCSLTLGELQRCAENILRLILQTSCFEDAIPYRKKLLMKPEGVL